ncbi:MAG: efflux RND transporter periplasmic adaptor subunit [Prolixibacteraceae bacterium]|nr:efflux RND transporter periplasmic adaptor subunit [Prolixibacteraceae bacterium]
MEIRKFIVLGIGILFIAGCSGKAKQAEISPAVVKTVSVISSPTARSRSYVGIVEESYGSMLSFATMGTVSYVNLDEGARVVKGQVLAEIDNTSASNAHEIALSTLNQAKDAYKRLSALYKKGSLPEIKYIDIQTKLNEAQSSEKISRKVLSDCVLRAPFSGYIASRKIDEGNYVMPLSGCFKIVKLDQIYVKLSVPEKEIMKISIGDKVPFTVAALGDKEFSGTVKEKGVQANILSHTYTVKLTLLNTNHDLLPGMVCSASICTTEKDSAVVLPQVAVMLDFNGLKYVWMAKDSKSEKRMIVTAGVNSKGVIVTGGLKVGEKVIVEGMDKVSEGTKIKEL